MQLLPECLNAVKETEYNRYKKELDETSKFYAEVSEPGQEILMFRRRVHQLPRALVVGTTACLLVSYIPWTLRPMMLAKDNVQSGCLLVRDVFYSYLYRLSKQSTVVNVFWKLQVESQSIVVRSKLKEKKAKAKVLKLQANQHVTITTVAIEQIQQYARSTNTGITKRFYDDDNEKTAKRTRTNKSEVDNSDSEGNNNFHAENYDHQDLGQTDDELEKSLSVIVIKHREEIKIKVATILIKVSE
ncbi:15544_t:CDS:2 [Rhizophagus irregularis]|nr:15544_t:CDS:2 [Rhizophagus irregularis]